MDRSTKKTTFVTAGGTLADGTPRPPSTYHVTGADNPAGGVSQRARQEHNHGPAVTTPKQAVHAFTDNPKFGSAARHNVRKAVAKGMDPRAALRLEMMDGLIKPTAKANDYHMEAFSGPLSAGNPHKSGGRVKFVSPGSDLENHGRVVAYTNMNKTVDEQQRLYVTQGVTTASTPESQKFNSDALQAQASFARQVLTKK